MTNTTLHLKQAAVKAVLPHQPDAHSQAAVSPAGLTGSLSAQVRSEELLRGHKAIAITHNGALYRLQTTRQGKLILTK